MFNHSVCTNFNDLKIFYKTNEIRHSFDLGIGQFVQDKHQHRYLLVGQLEAIVKVVELNQFLDDAMEESKVMVVWLPGPVVSVTVDKEAHDLVVCKVIRCSKKLF